MAARRDAELGRRVMAESDSILAKHDGWQEMVTFAGIGADGRDQQLDAVQMLTQLVQGWDYLIARNPKVLRWIVEQQGPHFAWPPDATEGCPTSPS